jgi:hypothetical protein
VPKLSGVRLEIVLSRIWRTRNGNVRDALHAVVSPYAYLGHRFVASPAGARCRSTSNQWTSAVFAVSEDCRSKRVHRSARRTGWPSWALAEIPGNDAQQATQALSVSGDLASKWIIAASNCTADALNLPGQSCAVQTEDRNVADASTLQRSRRNSPSTRAGHDADSRDHLALRGAGNDRGQVFGAPAHLSRRDVLGQMADFLTGKWQIACFPGAHCCSQGMRAQRPTAASLIVTSAEAGRQ